MKKAGSVLARTLAFWIAASLHTASCLCHAASVRRNSPEFPDGPPTAVPATSGVSPLEKMAPPPDLAFPFETAQGFFEALSGSKRVVSLGSAGGLTSWEATLLARYEDMRVVAVDIGDTPSANGRAHALFEPRFSFHHYDYMDPSSHGLVTGNYVLINSPSVGLDTDKKMDAFVDAIDAHLSKKGLAYVHGDDLFFGTLEEVRRAMEHQMLALFLKTHAPIPEASQILKAMAERRARLHEKLSARFSHVSDQALANYAQPGELNADAKYAFQIYKP